MVALVVKEQEMEMSQKLEVHPRDMVGHQNYKYPAREFCSAFRPVHSEHRAIVQRMLSTLEHPDDTTQVTWSSVHNYRCSVSVTGNTKNCWKQPEYEEISNDSKIGNDDDDEEIDVGSSYDTEISVQSMSDFVEESTAPVKDTCNNSTDDNLKSPTTPTADIITRKKETILQDMEIEFPTRREDLTDVISVLKSSFEVKSASNITNKERNSIPVICTVTPKVEMLSPTLSTSQEHHFHSPVRKNISDHQNSSDSFGLNWRNPEIFGSNSDVTSPISKSPPSIGSSSESLNSVRDVIFRRSSPFFPSDFVTDRHSFPNYSTENPERVFLTRSYILERSRSFGGGGGLIKRNPLYTRSYPIANSKEHEAFLKTSQTVFSTNLSTKVPSSVCSQTDDGCRNLANQEILLRRLSFGSTELTKISNLSFTSRNNSNTDEDDVDESPSNLINAAKTTDIYDERENFESPDTVITQNGYSASDDEHSSNSMKEMIQNVKNTKTENTNSVSIAETNGSAENIFISEECVRKDVSERHVEQCRKSVVVETKNCIADFSAEDFALRSRVLILLWVLLGERRLREVGYPSEPVHRLLWRAVDVCCSVAGVKSAAAVPLNSDHDCGSDMLCFRDHTHRFLEVCAPTREHWKQFGWASLTVDAVVRKIYQEELTPLLRIQSLPPDIQKAATYLAQLDRPTVMVSNPAQNVTYKSEPKQQIVAVPPKKKRGRPAKIAHKIEEGGRIERVMLWRFLLNLLEDPKNSPCIHWVQREEGIFRILNTDWLARLWGRRHGNPRMTYEKMARAMRTYYRSKVLQPVPRLRNLPRKLVYKFNPAVIQKVAAMKLSSSTFTGRGMNYNK